MNRYICIRKLEKNVNGETITAFPGSYWLMKEKSYWEGRNILINEYKPEWEIEVSDYVLELCFKSTVLR